MSQQQVPPPGARAPYSGNNSSGDNSKASQIPPPSVGAPFSETLASSGLPLHSSTASDSSVHGTAPGPPASYTAGAPSNVTIGGVQYVPADTNPFTSASSSATQHGGLTGSSSSGLPSAQQAKDSAQANLPSSGQVQQQAQQAKNTVVGTASQVAQSAKQTVQSAQLPAEPAHRPEGVARMESTDGVKNIISGIGGILVNAPAAALEAAATKAGHPEIAHKIEDLAAKLSGHAVNAGQAAYANAPTAEQLKGAAGNAYASLPTAHQVKSTAVNAHQSLPSVDQVKSTTGGATQTAAEKAAAAQHYAAQVAHDLAAKLPASVQAYVPEAIRNPQSTTGSTTTGSTTTSGSAPHTSTATTGSTPHATSATPHATSTTIGSTPVTTTTNTGIAHHTPLSSSSSGATAPGSGLIGGSATRTADSLSGALGSSPTSYPAVGSTQTKGSTGVPSLDTTIGNRV